MNNLRPWIRQYVAADSVTRFCAIVALSTGVAFSIGLLIPLVQDDETLLWSYAKRSIPNHSFALGVVITVALLIVMALNMQKLWRSLRLGLVPFSFSTWFLIIVIFWLLVFARHSLVATVLIVGAAIGALSIDLLRIRAVTDVPLSFKGGETDLPLPEDGHDLLGRGDAVESLIFKIVYEQPAIIAVTAPYGRGKTSTLRLTAEGELSPPGCTWTFLAPHIKLDIGGVLQRAGPKAGELTRRNERTIDQTLSRTPFFENRKAIRLYVVNLIGD